MFLGIFTTLLIPETKRRTLEELGGEWDMGSESITGAEHAKRSDSEGDSPYVAEKDTAIRQ